MESIQAQLEREMAQRGADRKASRHRRAVERSVETATAAGRRLMQELPERLVEAITAWKIQAVKKPGVRHAALDPLSKLDSRLVASLTLRVIIDALSQRRTYTKTAVAIGTRIEDELRFRSYREQDAISFKFAVRRSADYSNYEQKRRHILRAMVMFGFELPTWPDGLRAQVGTVLLELAIEHTGLVESTLVSQGRKTLRILSPTQDAITWCETVNERSEQLSPMYLPFLEEPLDWIDPVSGGWHSTNCFTSALVKTHDRHYLRILGDAKMPEVYSAVNALQRTAWRVNPEVYQVFSYFVEHGYQAVGLPTKEPHELPPKPADIAENKDSRRAWKKAARAVYDYNHRRSAERLAVARLHWTCTKYLESRFWFCHQLDWRGRAYPVSYYLHPQGGDLVRSLLTFADGKPIDDPDARRWHSIHGANCWGLDKVPFGERIAWVEQSREMLLRIAEDPLSCDLWQQADSPWQFLAWVLDWFQLENDPNHVSSLPIHQDATQSGLQIYSLLLRDPSGAAATNCLPSDAPKDLYQLVADQVTDLLKQDSEAGDKLADRWLEHGVTRGTCKRPVMTKVYNATRHSASNYVAQWVEEEGLGAELLPKHEDGRSPPWYLSGLLMKAMDRILVAASGAQKWFGEVASMFAARDLKIHWVTPVGLPVVQWYPEYGSKSVKTAIGERYRQVAIRKAKNTASLKSMKAALAPNVIHSLDAAAMVRTVNILCKDGHVPVSCVHDSFATVAADCQKLSHATREAYVEIFSRDVLADLRDQWRSQLPPDCEMPPLPEYGTLDIQALRQSLYFFS